MKNVSLYFKEGTSDKEYHLQLEKVKGGFVVNFQYGRRGSSLKSDTKTDTPVSEAEADKIYEAKLREQLRKGYSEGEKKKDFSEVSPTKSKEVVILPQLLNAVEDAQEFIDDDSYLAQEKMDGERRTVMANKEIKGFNKKGTEVPLPKTIIGSVNPIGDKVLDIVLDGEIIGSELFVWDLLHYNGSDVKNKGCADRIAMLTPIDFGCNIRVIETAYTKKEKQQMFDRLKKEGKEGIVFKKKNAPYTHGRPASGGNALKYKFYKTATFIVEGSTKGKRSVGLEVVSGKDRVFMGKVTIPPNHDIPKKSELVEVRYLYAYKDGAVFQPVYLGKRTDSDLTDATISQIVYKNEE